MALALKEIEEYAKRQLAPGWKLTGQVEQCPKTMRYHFQALLKTNQQRFGTVKRAMGTAHIEVARNVKALEQYVTKDKTKVADVDTSNSVPTLYEYVDIIASKFSVEDWNALLDAEEHATEIALAPVRSQDQLLLEYVDQLVAKDIRSGRRGAEFHAVNPAWRCIWKKFGFDIIARYDAAQQESPSPQADEASPAPPHNAE